MTPGSGWGSFISTTCWVSVVFSWGSCCSGASQMGPGDLVRVTHLSAQLFQPRGSLVKTWSLLGAPGLGAGIPRALRLPACWRA